MFRKLVLRASFVLIVLLIGGCDGSPAVPAETDQTADTGAEIGVEVSVTGGTIRGVVGVETAVGAACSGCSLARGA